MSLTNGTFYSKNMDNLKIESRLCTIKCHFKVHLGDVLGDLKLMVI